jgi:hypothetical protein
MTHSAAVLLALRRWPCSTSAELARRMGFAVYQVRRRLVELAARRDVEKLRKRPETVPCRVSRKRVHRWEALA